MFKMKIMSVVGARPNFMKAAPIVAAISKHNEDFLHCEPPERLQTGLGLIEHVLVHTGQHYDRLMSDAFFSDLGLPEPDIHLGVGSGSHAVQTAEIMRKFEEVLLREKPDVLIVVGDVNSTLACSLVAAKMSSDGSRTRPLIAHVEAGLRSFDRTMPEEINRILTDQLSDLLFVTEESGLSNLAREGVPSERVHFVGNTMIDSLLAYKHRAEASTILDDLGLRSNAHDKGAVCPVASYALLTLHRPANVDSRVVFSEILDGLRELAAEWPVIFPAHPRTQKCISGHGLERYFSFDRVRQKTNGALPPGKSGTIQLIEPLGYLDFLQLMQNAALVITDSGGIQEETTCLGVPCVTVRENTERPVTITAGTNVLSGLSREGIREAVRRQLTPRRVGAAPERWDGQSAGRILDVITRAMQKNVSRTAQTPQGIESPGGIARTLEPEVAPAT